MGHSEGSIVGDLASILDRLRVLERDAAGLRASDSPAAGAVLESIRRTCARLKKRLKIEVGDDFATAEADSETDGTSEGRTAVRSRGLRSAWGCRSSADARSPDHSPRAAARAAFADHLKAIKQQHDVHRRERMDWALRVLGVGSGSTMDDVRAAYRALIRQVHPDAVQGQGTSAASLPSFADVQQAWDTLRRAESPITAGREVDRR